MNASRSYKPVDLTTIYNHVLSLTANQLIILPNYLQTMWMICGCCSSRQRGLTEPWMEIESTPDNLLEQMLELYWIGVRKELANMILTLHAWSGEALSTVKLPDEEDFSVYGYDEFIDQVCEVPRYMAYLQAEQLKNEGTYRYQSVSQATQGIRDDLKATLAQQKRVCVLKRRARMLLQSAGFLDIDKLVEYRRALVEESFWKTPRIPQLILSKFDSYSMPSFQPLRCAFCTSVIRGIMFRCTKSDCRSEKQLKSSDFICEDCYREERHPQSHMVKLYKHSVLSEVITNEIGNQICRCSSVPRRDTNGRPMAVFPVAANVQHRASGGAKCGLLNLKDRIAEAKLEGQSLKIAKRKRMDEQERADVRATIKMHAKASGAPGRVKQVSGRPGTLQSQEAIFEDEKHKGVPLHLRPFIKKFPFGNVHILLMVGTILIENGASGTRGACISCRDPFYLQRRRDPGEQITKRFSLSPERVLSWQTRDRRAPKRLKACMKQVVGGAFSGQLDPKLENEITQQLITEATNYKEDFRDSWAFQERRLNDATERLFNKTKLFLEPRIRRILRIIVRKLFDPRIDLEWNKTKNNCQNFCDAIIDYEAFGALFGEATVSSSDQVTVEQPLYLMSFVCRPGSYTEATPSNKLDVPTGLTEEYLLKFRYGRHDDADIVDTLQEYWYDWGGFGKNLYRFQDLFPWDCTEAYDKYPGKCNDCSISKHVWSFPFDSWSIIQLHLQKDRNLYQGTPEEDGILLDKDWMRNRLKVLLAQDVLIRGAVEMARSYELRAATQWLHSQPDQSLDRYKLGGIHRAQPWSHPYEQGRYHEYFSADWIHMRPEDQIAAYEALRDFRQSLPDIPLSWSSTWHKGFEAQRTDPFQFFDGWWDFVITELAETGAPIQNPDEVHGKISDYGNIIGDHTVGDYRSSTGEVQGGPLPATQPDHHSAVDPGAGTADDGLYHANIDGVGIPDQSQTNNDGLGPVLGGADWFGSANPADSSSHLLGHGHHGQHGYHTLGSFGDRSSNDNSSNHGFGGPGPSFGFNF